MRKIVARLQGENQELADSLNRLGSVKAKLVRGGIIAELPRFADTASYSFRIPDQLHYARFSIETTECGGGMTNTGHASIICSTIGEKVRPFYIPRGGHLANGDHAFFSMPMLVEVTGYRNIEGVEIFHFSIFKKSLGSAEIIMREIWSGDRESLPRKYNYFTEAVNAAYEKANCYHCRHVHYAEGR